MVYRASILDATTGTTAIPVCGLDGGYTVTWDGGSTLTLCDVADLATAVDTYDLTTNVIDESCGNNAGEGYTLTRVGVSMTRTLRNITQSGGTLSVTSVGSFTMATSATGLSQATLSPDGTQIVVKYVGTSVMSAVNTGTGALDWTATLSGHSYINTLGVIAALGGDRVLVFCNTHSAVELWDGSTDTLLDSLAEIPDADTLTITAISATSALYMIQVLGEDPPVLRMELLDTTGDALSVTWGTTDINTTWSDGFLDYPSMAVGAWGTLAAVAPWLPVYDGAGPYPSLPIYLVDTTTGAAYTSTSDPVVAYGVSRGELHWCGSSAFVTHDFETYEATTSWSVSALRGPRRRAIGTSYHLRQRQTPYIR